jgi:PAS domain S-box-containing protein
MTEKKKTDRKNPDAGKLRKRAEKIAREKPENLEPLSPAEARKLIYELSVHQIELEMQNDELRAAEQRLEEAREQYFDLYDLAPVGYFSISEKGIILEANLTGANMLGVLPRDLRSRQFTGLIVEADQYIYYYLRKQLFTTKAPQVCEMRMVRGDGTLFWARTEATVAEDGERGKPVFRMTIHDITERKQGDEILQYSLSLLTASLESTADGLLIVDRQGKIVRWNQRFTDMWKIPEEVLASHDDEKAINHILSQLADPEQFVARVRKLYGQQDESSFDQIEFLDGRVFERYSQPQRIEDAIVGRVWSFRDVTERKKAEEALRQGEEKYRLLSENTTDTVWVMDMNFRIIYSSPSVQKLRGFTAQELMEMPLEKHMTTESFELASAMLLEELPRVKADPDYNPTFTVEIEYICKDGTTFLSEVKVSGMRDENGGLISIMGRGREITERKKVEKALREEGWRLQSIIEGTHAGTWEWNVQTGETVFNETWAQITGYTLDELSPISIKTWEALVHLEDLKQSDELLERHFSGELPYYDCECRMKHKDGHWVWIHDRGRVVTRTTDGKPLVMFGTHSDITDRKRMEEERERIEKLEAVGRLAGGIAHDFNNILTAILGNISLARMEAAPGSEISVSLEQAEQASLRAKDLTVQLLTFSKGGAPVKKLGSLAELLRDTADFVLRGSNVTCRYSIPADLWHAEIDVGQVSQVTRNLVVNAQQAMPAGGTIEISAENLALTEKQSSGRGLPLRPGNYVMISVADHGTGIPQDHLKKIFEPFFTTRPKSSGMGLATAFSIVRQHGGHLSVESKAGSGSTFYIHLPTSVESAAAKQDKMEAASRTGKARILVMDDEKTVRETAGRMLKHIGYADVEFATDGVEAIKLYKAAMESGNHFGAAILDLTIPGGMGGEVTVRNLLKIDPGVKAIVSSGYIDDPVMAKYKEYGFSGMVAKPYTLAELGKAVKDVIG